MKQFQDPKEKKKNPCKSSFKKQNLIFESQMLSFANKDVWVKGKLGGEGTLIPHPRQGHPSPVLASFTGASRLRTPLAGRDPRPMIHRSLPHVPPMPGPSRISPSREPGSRALLLRVPSWLLGGCAFSRNRIDSGRAGKTETAGG